MPPKRQRNTRDGHRKHQRRNNDTQISATPQPTHFHPLNGVSPTTSLFFDLPKEIRDQVYHEIWKQSTPVLVVYKQEKTAFKLFYDVAMDRIQAEKDTPEENEPYMDCRTTFDTGWLLTSRRIQEEAMEQLNRRSTWRLAVNIEFYQVKEDINSYGEAFQVNMPGSFSVIIAPPPTRRAAFLLQPSGAHTLILRTLTLEVLYELRSNRRGVDRIWSFARCTDQALKWIVPAFAHAAQLKCLYLHFSSNPGNDATSDSTITKFKHLTRVRLPNLAKVIIAIRFTPVHKGETTMVDDVLKNGISAMGRALVGGTGTVEFGTETEVESHDSVVGKTKTTVWWDFDICRA